jgi:hypothetical protein
MISMVETATKRCTKCGKSKPAGEFYAAKGGALGRRPECKACSNEYRNRWARRRYVPKTGRRYRTKRDREEAAAAGAPDLSP